MEQIYQILLKAIKVVKKLKELGGGDHNKMRDLAKTEEESVALKNEIIEFLKPYPAPI